MFDHCLIKITEDTSSNNFNNCIINLDPYELEEIANNNFELLQGSPALNNGSYQISFDNNNVSDINNILRNNPPDLGLYESNF